MVPARQPGPSNSCSEIGTSLSILGGLHQPDEIEINGRGQFVHQVATWHRTTPGGAHIIGMDFAIVAPTDWLPRHDVGFKLICDLEDDLFLHRERLESLVQEWIADYPDDPPAIQELQAWSDSHVFDALG